MGLALSRRSGERLALLLEDGSTIFIGVRKGHGTKEIMVDIEAPASVEVVREELLDQWRGRETSRPVYRAPAFTPGQRRR